MFGAKANLGFKVMNFAMSGGKAFDFSGAKKKTSGGSPPNYDYGRGGQQ